MKSFLFCLAFVFGCVHIPEMPNAATCVPSGDLKSLRCYLVKDDGSATTETVSVQPPATDSTKDGATDGATDSAATPPPNPPEQPKPASALDIKEHFAECFKVLPEKTDVYLGSQILGNEEMGQVTVRNDCAETAYATASLGEAASDYEIMGEKLMIVDNGQEWTVNIKFKPLPGDLQYGTGVKEYRPNTLQVSVTDGVLSDKMYKTVGALKVDLHGWAKMPTCPVPVIKAWAPFGLSGVTVMKNEDTVPVGSQVDLEGDASFGQEVGSDLAYLWQLQGPPAPPEGSATHFEPRVDVPNPSITFDVPGTYFVTLSVMQMVDGQSVWSCGPAQFTINVVNDPAAQ